MEREHSIKFTVSLKDTTIKEIKKQVRRDELYRENLLYLYGKYNNSRFLT